MADSTAMTVDFLRARLLSERSVSRAAKERADELANRVAELEEQVREVTAQRRHAERAATEVLAIFESQGFGGHLSDVLDSGSDHDEEPRDTSTGAKTEGSPGEEKAPPPAQGEAEDALSGTAQDGGLSWKGRSVSPRKSRQLKHKHRRSYFYFLASDPSPNKYRTGQSCRKNKRKELSNSRSAVTEEEGGNDAQLAESQKGKQDGSDCTDDGQANLEGEVAGDNGSSGDGGGQYLIRFEKDGEMERVLERQAELIGQYEAEEEAQRQWEKRFNENRTSSSSTKGDVEVVSKASQIENIWEQSNQRDRLPGQEPHCIEELKSGAEYLSSTSNNHHSADRLLNCSLPDSPQDASGQRDAHDEHHRPAQSQQSSNAVGAVAMQDQRQGDGNLQVRATTSDANGATVDSKVSDGSSSRFHGRGDNDQLGTSQDQQPTSSSMDVESVLQALQLARISLRQKLTKPVPPSQVTLALPALGDEHTEEDGYFAVDDAFNDARDEPCSSSEDLPVNDANISLTEELVNSSQHRQDILTLPAPGDDSHSMIDNDIKIPVGAAGLFRLPTDSSPACSGLSLRPAATARQNGFESNTASRVTVAPSVLRDDPSFSAKQCYDPHISMLLSVPASASGRCSSTSSDFTIGDASFLSGVPGLAEDSRKGRPLADADLLMQRGCDYSISNKWML
ncbi:hypothetical protein GUJ93_ZPchr0007g4047 [Zizania palustris]|uniref:Uncharacterized protein n=1 Tax=Zizania palustris TaxID=103762 RepID=A0A8J5VNC1_ZIZPA|nr:hypothetical protein GUJ93_ZPchr0007g4047 [Zizania palustris]